MKRTVGVLLITLALAGVATAWGSSKSTVRHLTSKDFDEVTADGKVYFVKCGHCKKMAPTWETLAKEYENSSDAEVVSVDCTKDKKVCNAAKVPGFPSLRIYFDGEQKEAFKGPRTLDNLKSFFEENIALLKKETVA